MMKTYKTIDEYIAAFPPEIQNQLTKIRQTIQRAAPEATEKISYGIPTFALHGTLVHFGAFKTHLSFFPGAKPIEVFKKELAKYKTAKGTIQLPVDEPLPLDLITKITKFRVEENLNRRKRK